MTSNGKPALLLAAKPKGIIITSTAPILTKAWVLSPAGLFLDSLSNPIKPPVNAANKSLNRFSDIFISIISIISLDSSINLKIAIATNIPNVIPIMSGSRNALLLLFISPPFLIKLVFNLKIKRPPKTDSSFHKSFKQSHSLAIISI